MLPLIDGVFVCWWDISVSMTATLFILHRKIIEFLTYAKCCCWNIKDLEVHKLFFFLFFLACSVCICICLNSKELSSTPICFTMIYVYSVFYSCVIDLTCICFLQGDNGLTGPPGMLGPPVRFSFFSSTSSYVSVINHLCCLILLQARDQCYFIEYTQ